MKPLPYNKATRTKKNTQQAKALKLMAICLMLFSGCTCSKQSPLRAYRYTPPPPPQETWTWTKLNWGGVEAQAVVVNPRDGNIVYVASRNDGIWKSTDEGESFAKLWDNGAWGFALDPNHLDVLYAACAGGGVWRSRDEGKTWSQLTNLYAYYVQPDRFDSSYIFAGPGRSTDYGASWTPSVPIREGPDDVKDLAQSWQNPNIVYAGCFSTYYGKATYKSTDRGTTWSPVDGGVRGGYWQMTIDPWDDQRVYNVGYYSPGSNLEAKDSLCRTMDGGASWEKFLVGRDTLFSSYIPVAVDPRPGLSRVIYSGGQGVHRSVDNGKTWETIGLDSIYVRAIAVDPTAPTNTTVLFAGAPCFGSPCNRLYRGKPGK